MAEMKLALSEPPNMSSRNRFDCAILATSVPVPRHWSKIKCASAKASGPRRPSEITLKARSQATYRHGTLEAGAAASHAAGPQHPAKRLGADRTEEVLDVRSLQGQQHTDAPTVTAANSIHGHGPLRVPSAATVTLLISSKNKSN